MFVGVEEGTDRLPAITADQEVASQTGGHPQRKNTNLGVFAPVCW